MVLSGTEKDLLFRSQSIKDKARFLPPTVYVNEQNYTKVHFSTDEEIDSSSTKRSGEVVEGGG